MAFSNGLVVLDAGQMGMDGCLAGQEASLAIHLFISALYKVRVCGLSLTNTLS